MTTPKTLQEPPDFSLTLGGPVFQLFRKAHLTGPALELLKRRILFICALTWLPLLVLAAIGGQLLGGYGLPFLRDIEVHVRFLIAVPALVIAELVVHQRTRSVLTLFLERGIVTPEDTSKFYAMLKAAMRVRNSVLVEVALLIFVYTAGRWVWLKEVALGSATWYALPEGGNLHLTLPGYWFAFASVPIFQFILLRWYFRLLIWFWFLWRVSRLNLRLMPTHPDGAGGIGFLGRTSYAFAPILFAQGALLAGIIANRVLYEGQKLNSLKMTILAFAGFFVLVILGPLTIFSPKLASAKRHGLGEYGTLATSYTADFDQKWLRGGAKDEAILGTADIQSLADLGNSYAMVRQMRIVPFGYNDLVMLVATTLAPILPLLLTIMPLEELLKRLLSIVF